MGINWPNFPELPETVVPSKKDNPDLTFNRREFLSLAQERAIKFALGAGGIGFVGATLYQRYQTEVLERELTEKTTPVLDAKKQKELDQLPRDGERELKRFFFGVSQEIGPFVEEITSTVFLEQFSTIPTDDKKHAFLVEKFAQDVFSATELELRIRSAADGIGYSLDRKWDKCCLALTEGWNLSLPQSNGVDADDLLKDVAPVIREQLNLAMDEAFGNRMMPFLRSKLKSNEEAFGTPAILLLRLKRITERLYLPAFCVQALHSSLEQIHKFVHDRANSYKFQISNEILELCNRVGELFQDELHERVSELHRWQRNALMLSVGKHASDATAWFS